MHLSTNYEQHKKDFADGSNHIVINNGNKYSPNTVICRQG